MDIEKIVETVAEKAEEVKEEVAEKVEAAKEAVEEKVEAAQEVAAEKAEAAKEAVEAKTEATDETMADYTAELEASYKKGPPKADDPTWDKFEQMLADKTVFEVKVDSVVKGGVVAFVDEVRAFIPASKLAAGYVENLDDYKGKNVEVMVITADREGAQPRLRHRKPFRSTACWRARWIP